MDNQIQTKNIIDLNDPLIDQHGENFLNDKFLSKIRKEIQKKIIDNPQSKKQIIKNFNKKKKYFKCDLRDNDSQANFEYFEKSTSEEDDDDMIIETKLKKKVRARRRRTIPQKKSTYDLQSDQDDIESINQNIFIDTQKEKSNFVEHLNCIFTKDKTNYEYSDNQFRYQININK